MRLGRKLSPFLRNHNSNRAARGYLVTVQEALSGNRCLDLEPIQASEAVRKLPIRVVHCTLDKKVFEEEAASASVQRFAATAAYRYEADDHSDGLLAGKSDGLDFH